MAVKVKLKELLLLAAVFAAHFDLSWACVQGELEPTYRKNVPDNETKVFVTSGMLEFGDPVIDAKSEDVDKYIGFTKGLTYIQLYLQNIQELEESRPSGPNPPSFLLDLVNFDDFCPIQKVDIRVTVIDTNNNDPFFTDKDGNAKGSFEVRVPMPLPQNVELQSFGAEIYAKDVDMSNTKVTFRVEPEDDDPNDLEIQYGGVVDDLSKVHRAVLRSTATLSYKERKYKLTVEDNGPGNKLTASGTLIVTRNEEESVIRPKFEKSSYIATFEDGLLSDYAVIVKDGKDDTPDIVEEAMKEFFQISAGTTAEEFIVKSNKNWDKKDDAIFTLRVDGPAVEIPAESVFIVKYEAEPPKTTHFDESSYFANFVDGLLKKLEIVVIDGSGDLPIIEGEQNIGNYFEVVSAPGLVNDKFIVQSNGDTKWEKDYDAVFTLKIDDATLLTPAETVVIVKIEKTSQPESLCADTGGLIAGIAVLACLLVLFIVAAVVFWYFKLRNRNTSSPYDDLLEDKVVQIDDNQNLSSTSVGDVKYDDSALSNPSFVDNPKRRNTGYVFNPPPPESDEDTTSLEDVKPKAEEGQTDKPKVEDGLSENPDKNPRLFERRRSVTFDDNVEKIQIEKSNETS